MNNPHAFFRFLIVFLFLGLSQNLFFNYPIFAQSSGEKKSSAYISDIEIFGTSDMESSQIIFLIESQIGDALDRKKISKDIHSIYKMKLFEDVKVEVKKKSQLDEDKGYILRFLVKERPRLDEVKLKGVFNLEKSEIEEKITLLKHDPYDLEKILLNEQIILEHYRAEGYPIVKVKSRIEKISSHTGNLKETG